MATGYFNKPLHRTSSRMAHTITSLKRWSITSRDLPTVSQIKTIHVYDFDNTLFMSPLPNPQLWNGQTIGFLQAYESFTGGGWWHDPSILAATGEGTTKEEQRGWKGWWNENIVRLAKMSMDQKDALTVLLTGRSESGFSSLIKRMVDSIGLDFDLICLKPEVGPSSERFRTTMEFKLMVLGDLILTYDQADEIRVYEDRIKHVKGFRDYFEQLNREFQLDVSASRKPITAEVIQVAEGCLYLSPVAEVAEVQRMINSHNRAFHDIESNETRSPYGRLSIKHSTYYTGYLIQSTDSSRLISQILNPLLPTGLAESNDLKYLANCILISPRPATRSILEKAGGMGKKLKWQITDTAVFENRIWAARVAPVPKTEKYFTGNPYPMVVLAVRKGVRLSEATKIDKWQPVSPDLTLAIETVVGEKVVLRVHALGDEPEGQLMNKGGKRRFLQERDEDILYPNRSGYDDAAGRPSHNGLRYRGSRHFQDEDARRGSYRGRGRGAGRARGYSRGARGRGRGRDYAGPGYHSLEDHGIYEGAPEEKNDVGSGIPMDY